MLSKHLPPDRATPRGVVHGYRTRRADNPATLIASWVANRYRDLTTGLPVRAAGCCLKAFRAEHAAFLLRATAPLEGCAHYFYPALSRLAGLSVTEIPVGHAPRRAGRTKFSLVRGRFLSAIRACATVRR